MRSRHGSRVLILGFLVSSCGTTNYADPIARFNSGLGVASSSMAGYYASMDGVERQLYLHEALYNPSAEVLMTDSAGHPTALAPTFSPASISARLQAIQLLTAYGNKLAALAATAAPTRFATAAQALGANGSSLITTFQGLAGRGDTTASVYIGPISTLTGIIGQAVLEHQRDETLRKAVEAGKKPVETILDQLAADMNKVIAPLRQTGSLVDLGTATNYYNSNRGTLSFGERQAVLASIQDLSTTYEANAVLDPGKQVDAVKDAFAALVTYAESPHKAKDLAAFAGALDAFDTRLQPFADAVAAARKGS